MSLFFSRCRLAKANLHHSPYLLSFLEGTSGSSEIIVIGMPGCVPLGIPLPLKWRNHHSSGFSNPNHFYCQPSNKNSDREAQLYRCFCICERMPAASLLNGPCGPVTGHRSLAVGENLQANFRWNQTAGPGFGRPSWVPTHGNESFDFIA